MSRRDQNVRFCEHGQVRCLVCTPLVTDDVLKELLKAGGAGLGSVTQQQLKKILQCKRLPYHGAKDVLVAQVKDAIEKGVVSHVEEKKPVPVHVAAAARAAAAVKKAIVKGVTTKYWYCCNACHVVFQSTQTEKNVRHRPTSATKCTSSSGSRCKRCPPP